MFRHNQLIKRAFSSAVERFGSHQGKNLNGPYLTFVADHLAVPTLKTLPRQTEAYCANFKRDQSLLISMLDQVKGAGRDPFVIFATSAKSTHAHSQCNGEAVDFRAATAEKEIDITPIIVRNQSGEFFYPAPDLVTRFINWAKSFVTEAHSPLDKEVLGEALADIEAAAQGKKFEVFRIDTHGNQMTVSQGLTLSEAKHMVEDYEAKGHKQGYFYQEEQPPQLDNKFRR